MVKSDRSPLALLRLDFDRPAMRLDDWRVSGNPSPRAASPRTPSSTTRSNRLNTRGRSFAAMPEPLSLMEITALSASPPALSRMRPLRRCRRWRYAAPCSMVSRRRRASPKRTRPPANAGVELLRLLGGSRARRIGSTRHRPAMSTRSISSATPRVSPVVRSSSRWVSFDRRSTDSRIALT